MVRIITARPGLQPVVETMEALTPALIRSATGRSHRVHRQAPVSQ
jgi:hypothetical protein